MNENQLGYKVRMRLLKHLENPDRAVYRPAEKIQDDLYAERITYKEAQKRLDIMEQTRWQSPR